MDLLSTIETKAKAKPARLLLFAPPKWGKSSWAAFAPDPIFLLTRGEDGLKTLLAAGRLPDTPHFPQEAARWPDLIEAVDALAQGRHGYKTLVLDVLNGAARLLAEYVCERDFQGNWVQYDAYGRGIKPCIPLWIDLLERLEWLRAERGMSVVLLCHSRVKAVKNPGGSDYDQHQPELDDALAGLANKWADCLLYGGFEVQELKTGGPGGKVKAQGGAVRTILTGESAAHVTGNRYGLPRLIRGGTDAKATWDAFAGAMRDARSAAPAAKNPKPVEVAKPKPTEQPDGNPEPTPAGDRLFPDAPATNLPG